MCPPLAGPMGFGNKGAVSIRFELGATSFCFINSHLAAHQENVAKRNEDFHEILEKTQFWKPPAEEPDVQPDRVSRAVRLSETERARKRARGETQGETEREREKEIGFGRCICICKHRTRRCLRETRPTVPHGSTEITTSVRLSHVCEHIVVLTGGLSRSVLTWSGP